MARAKEGKAWAGSPPRFREFVDGEWRITERGHKFRKLLEKYVQGKQTLRSLVKEFGFTNTEYVSHSVRYGQLAASPYIATFHVPEIGIINEKIAIPQIPPVISPELEKQAIDRFEHNKTFSRPTNKENKEKYLLQTFVFCNRCGRAMTCCYNKYQYYYVHVSHADKKPCIRYVRMDQLHTAVLDYLFAQFFDKAGFEQAISHALPSDDERQEILSDVNRLTKRQKENAKEIQNLINAIKKGADVSLLLDEQQALKDTKESITKELSELKDRLATFPDQGQMKQQGEALRAMLQQKYANRDWRDMTKDEIQTFLRFIFGDNLSGKKRGILLDQTDDGIFSVTLNGRFRWFTRDCENGKPYPVSPGELRKKMIASLGDFTGNTLADALIVDTERECTSYPSFFLTANTWVGMAVLSE